MEAAWGTAETLSAAVAATEATFPSETAFTALALAR